MRDFSYSPVLGNRALEQVCSQMPNSTGAALSVKSAFAAIHSYSCVEKQQAFYMECSRYCRITSFCVANNALSRSS